jgi:hypothetical protein
MSAMRLSRSCAVLLSLVSLLGCGGGGKPAESAEGEPEAKADAKDATKEGDTDAKSDDAKSGDKDDKKADAKPAPADDGPKPSRTAQDILTSPDVVYLFSFNDSEPKQAAEEKCTKKAGDNPKKMNECMAAERKKFPADGHRFKKDERDQWWWITVRQNGNRLVALHKIPVEFGEETPTSVTLKPVGKDKGSAPMNPPAKIVFEVPNDYQIAIKDPKAGRLVFQAKVGVVTE